MTTARSYAEVIASGDRLDSLKATRDLIAARIEQGVPARDLASLTRRLLDVMEQIEALSGDEEVDHVDQIAQRRAARLAAAQGREPAEPDSEDD